MLHQDMMQEVECPECGSEEIELQHWVEPGGASHYHATCECGFEHEDSYSAREIAISMSSGGDQGSYPLDYPPVDRGGLEADADLKFSPRLFLENAG